MAVGKNPYREWEKNKKTSDYRCTDTQVISLVRQQLSQSEYLMSLNRVNSGPKRNLRAKKADISAQIPHVFGSEDMWGWQPWTNIFNYPLVESSIATSLIEENPGIPIPGISYMPYNRVGGATHIEIYTSFSTYTSDFIDIQHPISVSPAPITSAGGINGISVNTGNLSSSTNNYVMVYDSLTNKFIFISPSELYGYLDGDDNPASINLGSY
jgi:hypothetical protein